MAVLRCVAGVDQIGSGGGVENWSREPPECVKIDCGQTNHLRHRLDTKNFTKIYRFLVTSNL
jgi:hypothetical protein